MNIIYVLRLEEDKYYVGKTKNLAIRIEQHKNGFGAVFTKRYKFIDLVEQIETDDPFAEDNVTKRYMKKYGIDNVRGGTYTQLDIDQYRVALEAEFKTLDDVCFGCGLSGHYKRQCPGIIKQEEPKCVICNQVMETDHDKFCFPDMPKVSNKSNKITNNSINTKCDRCGRSGHLIDKCYANTDIYGNKLDEETKRGRGVKKIAPSHFFEGLSEYLTKTEDKISEPVEIKQKEPEISILQFIINSIFK